MPKPKPLEECTLKYWIAAHAWNSSTHKKSKVTVAQGIKLLDEASKGSPRLTLLCLRITDQIVTRQAEVKVPTEMGVVLTLVGGQNG